MTTPGALEFCRRYRIDMFFLINRHVKGDWGDVDLEDKMANNAALKNGSRLLSVYRFEAGRLWILTEADRSVTTVLLPEEY